MYNAWKFVFGETKWVLCFFHIDCAWRKKLNELIKDKQQLLEAYHQLRSLLTKRNKAKFHILLQQFVSRMKEYHPSFYTYFSTTYARKSDIWATCYRVGTIANTNMYLEAFHRKLKVVYLNNKQNWRLDYLLHILFKNFSSHRCKYCEGMQWHNQSMAGTILLWSFFFVLCDCTN